MCKNDPLAIIWFQLEAKTLQEDQLPKVVTSQPLTLTLVGPSQRGPYDSWLLFSKSATLKTYAFKSEGNTQDLVKSSGSEWQ